MPADVSKNQLLQRLLSYQMHHDQEKTMLILISIAGLIAHTVFLLIFIAIDLYIMAWVNVVSVAVWMFSLRTSRRGNYVLSTVLISIEITLHAVIAVYFTGLESGFQYYLWPAVLIGAVVPNGYSRYVFLCLTVLLGGIFWVHNFGPASVLTTPNTVMNLNRFNLAFAAIPFVFATIIVRFLYQQRFQAMEIMAYRDGLTKLFNRRYTDTRIQHLRNQSPNGSICLVLGDIDYFKAVNDNLGHGEGDKVLVQVAEFFQHQLSGVEFCSRWGGEEFLLVMPNHNLIELTSRITAICLDLPNAVSITGWENPVTCSFGAVELRQNEPLIHAISRADELLYQAKSNGRYQVCFEKQL